MGESAGEKAMRKVLMLGLVGALALAAQTARADQMADIMATQELSQAIERGDLSSAETAAQKIGDTKLKDIGYANVFAAAIQQKDCRRASRVLNSFNDQNLRRISEMNYKLQCG